MVKKKKNIPAYTHIFPNDTLIDARVAICFFFFAGRHQWYGDAQKGHHTHTRATIAHTHANAHCAESAHSSARAGELNQPVEF